MVSWGKYGALLWCWQCTQTSPLISCYHSPLTSTVRATGICPEIHATSCCTRMGRWLTQILGQMNCSLLKDIPVNSFLARRTSRSFCSSVKMTTLQVSRHYYHEQVYFQLPCLSAVSSLMRSVATHCVFASFVSRSVVFVHCAQTANRSSCNLGTGTLIPLGHMVLGGVPSPQNLRYFPRKLRLGVHFFTMVAGNFCFRFCFSPLMCCSHSSRMHSVKNTLNTLYMLS